MTKIAVLDDYQDVALHYADWSALQSRADVTVFRDHLSDTEALVERLHPFDALCVMRERTPLTAHLLDRLPNLKFVSSTGLHNASIDFNTARARGIVVSGTAGSGTGTPELTWALILAAARHFPRETASLRSGGWQVGIGTGLAGSTLGILGLGKIGSKVAAVGRAFGMNVIAWSQNLTAEAAQSAGATLVDKATLLRESDWLTLHLVLSERSRGMIGASELALMKPSAWLVNTSRGPLVDETALVDVLMRRSIAGAALDTFDIEPLPEHHAFRQMDNVVATPHIGYVTEAGYKIFFEQTVENLMAWLDGTPLRVM